MLGDQSVPTALTTLTQLSHAAIWDSGTFMRMQPLGLRDYKQ